MTPTNACRPTFDVRRTDLEAELVRQLRAGSGVAYEQLFREYSGRLLAAARGFLSCEDECADAVQDTFVSAFKAIGSFAGGSQLGTWLHRILVNHCLMRLRRQKRSGAVSLDGLPEPAGDRFGRGSAQPDRLERNELLARVRAEIDRLPASYREIIVLRDIEGLDTDAAAARLGTSRAVVKTRLHRARTALRAAMGPSAEFACG